MSLSPGIVIPTFREAENIAALVEQLRAVAPDARMVVVDDSPDLETVNAVAPMAGPTLEIVHRGGKGGRGSAVLEGMRALVARGVDVVVEMDADHSHPPSELPRLLDEFQRERLDLLIASRYLKDSRIENWPLTRRLFSRAANRLARATLGVPVHDYTNGYRLYSRRAAELVVAECGKSGSGFIASERDPRDPPLPRAPDRRVADRLREPGARRELSQRARNPLRRLWTLEHDSDSADASSIE